MLGVRLRGLLGRVGLLRRVRLWVLLRLWCVRLLRRVRLLRVALWRVRLLRVRLLRVTLRRVRLLRVRLLLLRRLPVRPCRLLLAMGPRLPAVRPLLLAWIHVVSPPCPVSSGVRGPGVYPCVRRGRAPVQGSGPGPGLLVGDLSRIRR
ncbi:hypothetical protein ABB07_26345 [Streptomyces incarnatus]|uniref:Uncharacterized protein n=1 Tax=Streptomyces incarnatus TaxID=665007 RepID=A0ABM5TQN8_9ACTN|nr:hypothetical protein ABB07_26345 [Streptomyces incarnatus]